MLNQKFFLCLSCCSCCHCYFELLQFFSPTGTHQPLSNFHSSTTQQFSTKLDQLKHILEWRNSSYVRTVTWNYVFISYYSFYFYKSNDSTLQKLHGRNSLLLSWTPERHKSIRLWVQEVQIRQRLHKGTCMISPRKHLKGTCIVSPRKRYI